MRYILAEDFALRHGSAHGIVYDRLEFSLGSCKVDSKIITGERKRKGLNIFQGLFNQCRNWRDSF
jgi:hypothetical protein